MSGFSKQISEYFDDPTMTKVKQENGVSLYMVKIKSYLLSNDTKYIAVTLPSDNKLIGDNSLMSELSAIISIQTRTISDKSIPEYLKLVNKQLFVHNYIPKKIKPWNSELTKTASTVDGSYYETLPDNIYKYRVYIFHKSNDMYECPAKCSLNTALESYSTIMFPL
jgi:hypothetical protein